MTHRAAMRRFGLAALCGMPLGDRITRVAARVDCPTCLERVAHLAPEHLAALDPPSWFREDEHGWLCVLGHPAPEVRARAPRELLDRYCAPGTRAAVRSR